MVNRRSYGLLFLLFLLLLLIMLAGCLAAPNRSTLITALALQNNTLWLCGPDRLESLNLLDNTFQRFDPSDFSCEHLFVAKNGWIWAYRDTVRFYDGTKWHSPIPDNVAYPIRAVSETSDGLIWISSSSLIHYNSQTDRLETVIQPEPVPTSTTELSRDEGRRSNRWIFGPVFEAADGALWFNKPLSGIVRWERDSNLTSVWGADDGFDGFEPVPTKFIQATDGSIWVGTLTGVYRFHDGVWQSWRLPNEGPKSRDMDDFSVLDMMKDSEGKIWVVFQRAGVMFWDSVRWNIVGPFEYPNGNRPQSVFQSSSGAIWIGFMDRDTVKYTQGRLWRYPTNIGTFLEALDHNLFGGGDGFFLYNLQTDQWEPYPSSQCVEQIATITSTQVANYVYDAANRLTSANGQTDETWQVFQ